MGAVSCGGLSGSLRDVSQRHNKAQPSRPDFQSPNLKELQVTEVRGRPAAASRPVLSPHGRKLGRNRGLLPNL
jgi:hypothetical protein